MQKNVTSQLGRKYHVTVTIFNIRGRGSLSHKISVTKLIYVSLLESFRFLLFLYNSVTQFFLFQTPEPLQNGLPSFLSEEESQPKAPGSPTVIITDADGAHTVVTSTTPSPGSAVNVWKFQPHTFLSSYTMPDTLFIIAYERWQAAADISKISLVIFS